MDKKVEKAWDRLKAKGINSDEKISKYTLTIPNDLLVEIKALAYKKGMSINSFVLLIISQYLEN
jgi:predicted HicB family RNase H-like nuclease